TWETTEQTDIGLDMRALNDRLTFNFDWYIKTSKDLLVTITPPYETGQSSATINAGNVRNSGIELELGWQDNIGDFKYGASANMATLKNEVTYLDPSISRINGASMHISTGLTVFEEGYPVWYMRGWVVEDIDDVTGDPIFVDQPTVDTDGDGEGDEPDGAINADDKVMLGKGIPDLTYGITFNAAFKGFDLLVFGAGQAGNEIYNCFTRVDRPNGNKLSYFYDDRWTASNTTASIPRPGANQIDYYYASSGVIFNGSFFKIKQIQLGYTIPSNLTRKLYVSNLRVYCSLDDWITFSDYIGYDPEVSTNAGNSLGIDKGAYPIAKKFLFGLNITF
ncbi:MAG: TonB-dependent receptor, partial [Bacteroidales bacterium]|nr:TonB-dependent receptor [Bacteroidales bacterium]